MVNLTSLDGIGQSPLDPVGANTVFGLYGYVYRQVLGKAYPATGPTKKESPVVGRLDKIGSEVKKQG